VNILYPKELWSNGHLSLARYYGSVKINGKVYTLVDKNGKKVLGVAESEPHDLIDERFIPLYKKLGREKFLQVIAAFAYYISSPSDMKKIINEKLKDNVLQLPMD
jgi:hypothetical protein